MRQSMSREEFDPKWEESCAFWIEKLGPEGMAEFLLHTHLRWFWISEQVDMALEIRDRDRCKEWLAVYNEEFGHQGEECLAVQMARRWIADTE